MGADIQRIFHVFADSTRRRKKRFQQQGEAAYSNENKRRGQSHKLLPGILDRIQIELDKGRSVNSIAKGEHISEGTIRYAKSLGRFKS